MQISNTVSLKKETHQSQLLGVKVLLERVKTVREMLNGTCRMWVQACEPSVCIKLSNTCIKLTRPNKYVQFQKKKQTNKQTKTAHQKLSVNCC